MTADNRTRQASVTAYYLGRPAALWKAASAARAATEEHRTARAPARVRSASPRQHTK